MTTDTMERLDHMFSESPLMRAEDVPSADEVDSAAQNLGVPFPRDYREFVLRYGGAVVGPYSVYGLRPCHVMDEDRWSVVDITNELRATGVKGVGSWIIFSEDHSGNPIGMDADGMVWIFDYDFGGVTELAANFEEYIRRHCLKVIP